MDLRIVGIDEVWNRLLICNCGCCVCGGACFSARRRICDKDYWSLATLELLLRGRFLLEGCIVFKVHIELCVWMMLQMRMLYTRYLV